MNGDEITVHQVNAILARSHNIDPAQAGPAKRQVLERLIDQHLAKQRAVEKKLDRSPGTVQSIEAARNEILANAYLQTIAAGVEAPKAEDVKKYYAAHPELFAERRLFALEEISLERKAAPSQLRAVVAKSRELREVAAWLQSNGIAFVENRGARAAEQLPLEWLPQLHKMRDGEMQAFENEGKTFVLRIVASKPVPVDEAAAAPRIVQFLSNQKLSQAIASDVKQMRGSSNIEYLGEFAGEPKAASTVSPPQEKAQATGMEKGIKALR